MRSQTDRPTRRAPAAGGARGFVRGTAAVLGVTTLVLGLWAFLAPESFYDNIAIFPPYNEHLLHDVGAFQIGMAVPLLLAVRWNDGLMLALAGFAAGGGVHTIGHMMDSDLGGRPTDVPSLGVMALIAILALVLRARELGRSS